MDQIKIGQFIAQMRKEKGMTQRQLADELLVSDKTVSKWERGKSLPSLEIMNLLCQIFDISINELLLGERITAEELKHKSEENIKALLRKNETNRKNNLLNIVLGLSVLTLCLLLFLLSLLGTDFAKVIWYIDLPSIIAVAGILTAIRLLSKKKCFVERCIFPVGVMTSIMNIIAMLNSATDNYLKNFTVCILPVLYSAVIYIVTQCLKNLKVRKK